MLRRLLLVHLALAVLLGVGLVAAAFHAVRTAADAAADVHIANDIQLLQRRYRGADVVDIANEIEIRATMHEQHGHEQHGHEQHGHEQHGHEQQRHDPSGGAVHPRDGSAQADQWTSGEVRQERLYLLVRSDGTRVVGNLPRWPDAVARRAGELRFDGVAAGVQAGRIRARATTIDNTFLLLVGHRQSSVDALAIGFLPVALAIIAVPCLLAVVLTLHVDRRYKARVAAINAVFDKVRGGALESRVATPPPDAPDELDQLAQNVDAALAEVARMVRGLDAASQAAAHELNRELTRLRDDARADGAARFVTASEQLIALLRQLLELSRVETGTTLDARRVDLATVARDALQLYDDALDAAGVSAQLEVSAHDGTQVQGHGELIGGAVVNLLENAVKHSPPGGVVRVVITTNPNEVAISIEDQGPGSAATDIGSLIASSKAPGDVGYGFGLRFVQAVAIRHGARIAIADAHPGLIVTIAFRR